MKRHEFVFLLVAFLIAASPTLANVPVPTSPGIQLDPAEQFLENAFNPFDFQSGAITAPTIHQWSSGQLFFGSFQSGYGTVKTPVPRFMSGRIICVNDPVNMVDPDGKEEIYILLWKIISGSKISLYDRHSQFA